MIWLLILNFLVFFIYILVSYFRTDAFLILFDIFMLVGVINCIATRKFYETIIKQRVVFSLCAIYFIALLFGIIVETDGVKQESIVAFRNLIFPVGVLLLSSTYINTITNFKKLMTVIVVSSVICSIYGFKQILFGYHDFELERISLMGATLREIETLDRFRIVSTFGDPLTFGVVLLISLYCAKILGCLNKPKLSYKIKMNFSIFVLFASLIMTLSRAPLLGFFVGLLFSKLLCQLSFRRAISRLVLYCIAGISTFFLLSAVVENNILVEYDVPLIGVINSGIESFWSLFSLGVEDVSSDQYFIIAQSRDSRANSWIDGLDYLVHNPFGAGLSIGYPFAFSVGDVGILKLGLQTGFMGLTIMALMTVYILAVVIKYSNNCKLSTSIEVCNSLVGMWLGLIVTACISSIHDSVVIEILVWSLAGSMLNINSILRIDHKKLYTN